MPKVLRIYNHKYFKIISYTNFNKILKIYLPTVFWVVLFQFILRPAASHSNEYSALYRHQMKLYTGLNGDGQ